FARHLLRRRAFPLHHGGWRNYGLPGRNPLLVAEDYGTLVPGISGTHRRNHVIRRLQPDVLPAVHSRISRHAAALSQLSTGVSGTQRDVHSGRFDFGSRLFVADGLSDLVHALWQSSRQESLARDWTGVGHGFAAAHRKLPRNTCGGLGTV